MPSKEPGYVFTRDYEDNNRINLQHYLWAAAFGYLLHPNIPTDKPDLRVADVGTGTSIWLSSLARILLPTVQLDGFDVSLDATPPEPWLYKNLKLRLLDITQDIPEELVGVYDVVHIRLFLFVLRDEQVPGVLKNLRRLLKPGGYLQWGDVDAESFKIVKTSPEKKISAQVQVLQLSQGQDARLKPTWVAKLPQLFADAGFEDVVPDVRDLEPDLAFMMHEANMGIHELIVKMTGNKEVEEGLKKLMPEWCAEVRDGTMWTVKRSTIVGRKGLEEK